MLKRLYPVAVITSLIICVTAIAVWATTYDGHNSIIRTRFLPPDPTVSSEEFTPVGVRSSEVVAVVDGEFICGASRTPARGIRPTSGWHLFMLPSRNLIGDESFLHRLGLDLTNKTTPQGKSIRLQFPMWLLVMLTAILPGWWYLNWSRERAAHLELCTTCGYNLTGLEVNDCPNCRTPAARPAMNPTPAYGASAR